MDQGSADLSARTKEIERLVSTHELPAADAEMLDAYVRLAWTSRAPADLDDIEMLFSAIEAILGPDAIEAILGVSPKVTEAVIVARALACRLRAPMLLFSKQVMQMLEPVGEC